ncbi:hypothetical protein DL897_16930 [Thermoflavimicrobium daqui]|jgi:hypothetical protein|uniref:Uncharacterized protein n=1 Tax=Thermoflavimicrobium daqui TaxID=2137476 RepID=A0A364K0V5_9BACL|nr:hypothetical protein DL897_16930 [Thermoflavimicrobium daqui]
MIYKFAHRSPYSHFWLVLLVLIIVYFLLGLYFLWKKSEPSSAKTMGFWALSSGTFLFGIKYLLETFLFMRFSDLTHNEVIHAFKKWSFIYDLMNGILILLFVTTIVCFIVSMLQSIRRKMV